MDAQTARAGATRGSSRLETITGLLKKLDPEFVNEFRDTNCLFKLLHIKSARMLDGFVQDAIRYYYNTDTNVFYFNELPLGITLQDVLYLTGLPIKGKPVFLSKSVDHDAFQRVFGLVNKKKLTLHELSDIASSDVYTVKQRKIAVLLILLLSFIMPSNNKNGVPPSYVQLVEDLDEVDSFAWGAALLGFLYDGIKRWKKTDLKYISGNLWVVLAFLLIRIPKLRNMIGLEHNMEDARAPLLPWVVERIGKISHNHIATYDVRSVIDALSDEDIELTPYAEMECPIPSNISAVTALVPLICCNIAVHHMPQHCSKQFSVLQKYDVMSTTWKSWKIEIKMHKGYFEQHFEKVLKEELEAWERGTPAEETMTLIQPYGSSDSELEMERFSDQDNESENEDENNESEMEISRDQDSERERENEDEINEERCRDSQHETLHQGQPLRRSVRGTKVKDRYTSSLSQPHRLAEDVATATENIMQKEKKREDVATASTENIMQKEKKRISFADKDGGVLRKSKVWMTSELLQLCQRKFPIQTPD